MIVTTKTASDMLTKNYLVRREIIVMNVTVYNRCFIFVYLMLDVQCGTEEIVLKMYIACRNKQYNTIQYNIVQGMTIKLRPCLRFRACG